MLPAPARRVIQLLSRLSGVGEKTAQRFALELITDPEFAAELGRELEQLPAQVGLCESCGNLAEIQSGQTPTCPICADSRRNPSLLCVVARVQDLMAFERSGAMRGRYFVLGRLLSPLDGIGPDKIRLSALEARIQADQVREVILATPPTVDGEATALYLARELGARGLVVTRIASGVPHGGDLEFADQITLGRAIEGRRGVGS
jgi:recombination protein RecR